MVPREDNASDHVLELLQPYTKENGGPLEVERVHFTPGRGNVIVKYQGMYMYVCMNGMYPFAFCSLSQRDGGGLDSRGVES